MRKRLLLALPLLIVLAVVLWKALGHDTPPGQRPLTILNPATLAGFQRDFDLASDQARIIVLLSPT